MAASFTHTIDVQHLPICEEESKQRNTFIPASAFQEECRKVISSLFIELLLARLTAERGAGKLWYGRGESVSPTRSAL
jgi:hypothetical protein